VDNKKPSFRSLRLRLLLPIIATALLAAVVVATASYWLGARWAQQELASRFAAIRSTLTHANYPLNAMVLDSLAQLTQTELIGLDQRNQIVHSTVEIQDQTAFNPSSSSGVTTTNDNRRYRVFTFPVAADRQDRVASVAVLFAEVQIDASRRRAALLPLVTFVLASRLVRRIGKLQQQVESVASGNFLSTVSDEGGDELGRLGTAVDSMAGQLNQLWKQVNREQGEKLLHQIASGLAHQLRNSLTGARMAVELHAKDCRSGDQEGLEVAVHQIEVSEDHVRRLLLAASGRQDEDRPMNILKCFEDVRHSLSPIAKHLRVEVEWTVDENLNIRESTELPDGPTWIAAVTNLVHNAMQAGDVVKVELKLLGSGARLLVIDNGAGIPDSIAKELFEPFVTSKPEGMGLGLSVVQRAAERLGGAVRWRRENERTIFELDVNFA
jgi:signal transduction histidine kinase